MDRLVYFLQGIQERTDYLYFLISFVGPFVLVLVRLRKLMLGLQFDSLSCEYGVLLYRTKVVYCQQS
jgi:hypothetical protein